MSLNRSKQILELNNSINEIKNTIKTFSNRIDQAEVGIPELENRFFDITESNIHT